MDRHLESSVLLILAAVIFIKPICSIKVCTCGQYIVPSSLLVCIRKKTQNSRRIFRDALRDFADLVWVPAEFPVCGAKQGNEDLNMTPQQTGAPFSLPAAACDPIHPKTKSPDEHSGD